MNNTKQDAQGRWYGILTNFIESEYLTGKHTKCPICGGKDRFRFDNKDGGGTYYCNSCGAGTGIHLLAQHQGISHSEAWKIVVGLIGTTEIITQPKVDYLSRVKEILGNCTEGGELVRQYLASRGIHNAPETLLAGFYWVDKQRCKAMIARASKGTRLTGVHATFIKDGKKIARRMYSVEKGSMSGSAIRLHRLYGGDSLVIGEGIETSLSAGEICGLPVWAAMDAGKLEQVEIPEQVKRVVIAGDNDESYTGQSAAYALAKRLKLAGKSVEVMIPPKIGDWNDVKRENGQAKGVGVSENDK